MEFRAIRYALAVAKERSFTRAAARVNVSQSAVSEQVKLLEARIGFDLFRRTGRGIEPTDRGRMFLAEAERVASDLLALQDVASRLAGLGVETVSLGHGSGLAPLVFSHLLKQGIPASVRLDVKTAPTRVIFDELAAGRIDLGISTEVRPDRIPAGIIASPLDELEMILILPNAHPLCENSGPIDISLLAEEPFILNELSVGYGELVMNAFTDLGLRPSIRATADNIETIKVMVQSGAGLALVPAGSADAETELGKLQVRSVTPLMKVSIDVYTSRFGLPRRKAEILGRLFDAAGWRFPALRDPESGEGAQVSMLEAGVSSQGA